jgi:hypothetical protein
LARGVLGKNCLKRQLSTLLKNQLVFCYALQNQSLWVLAQIKEKQQLHTIFLNSVEQCVVIQKYTTAGIAVTADFGKHTWVCRDSANVVFHCLGKSVTRLRGVRLIYEKDQITVALQSF